MPTAETTPGSRTRSALPPHRGPDEQPDPVYPSPVTPRPATGSVPSLYLRGGPPAPGDRGCRLHGRRPTKVVTHRGALRAYCVWCGRTWRADR